MKSLSGRTRMVLVKEGFRQRIELFASGYSEPVSGSNGWNSAAVDDVLRAHNG